MIPKPIHQDALTRQIELIVTGTGRCGTGYLAALCNEAGLRCGHEAFFFPEDVSRRPSTEGLRAESSWMAVPVLEHLPDHTPLVLHLVRQPSEVWLSLISSGFFFNTTASTMPYTAYALRHSVCDVSEDPGWTTVAWMLEWTRRADDLASRRVKVEQATRSEALYEAVRRLGVKRKAWKRACAQVPHDVNARPSGQVAWDQLAPRVIEGLATLQERLGYR